MQPLLTMIGAMVALVATSVGVIAAIEQLTLRARLRRTADLAQALSGHENDHPERQTVLRSIHDVAVARLVSGWLLPWWRFTQFAVWFLVGPVVVAWIVAATGWTVPSLATALTCFVLLATTTRQGRALLVLFEAAQQIVERPTYLIQLFGVDGVRCNALLLGAEHLREPLEP